MTRSLSLSPDHHRTLVNDSAIDPEIIKERGYFTATNKQQAIDLGFARIQARQGLVLPIHSLGGTVAGRQLRPDEPREMDGKIVKYETPRGARAVPDVHPRMQPQLRDGTAQLWITEGIKKGDSAASKGLPCIALTGGVWGFRNKQGLHGELRDLVAWRGPQGQPRQVTIAFDSDVVSKAGVHGAAQRLATGLISLGASPRFLVLPPGRDGKKQGLDDFFAAGGTVDQLEDLIVDRLPPLEGPATSDVDHLGGGSMADQLVELVRDDASIELFHAQGDSEHGYATVKEEERSANFVIDGTSFRGWLTKTYLDVHGRAPTAEALANAINTLKALAIHRGKEHPVALRVGSDGADVYLDLGGESWRAVRISSGKWDLVRNSPVRFVRSASMRELPAPTCGGSIERLWPLVNIQNKDHQILFVCWLVAALCPSGPYPILMLHGQQGSAKSFTTSVARRLVDPNSADLRRPPKSEEDLMVSAGCNHVQALENLSNLPDWLSDALCALSTGSGFATRQLYTNKEESVIQACRPVILNGIPALGTRGDFVERCVNLELPPIEPGNRKSSSELEQVFLRLQAEILGALLDILAKVLQLLPSIKLTEMPRMADFAKLGVAVERACGWPDGSFLLAYARNAEGMNLLALESGLGGLLAPLVEGELAQREPGAGWPLSMKELLKRLRDSVYDDRERRRWLPSSERGLRTGLDRLAPILKAIGILVTYPSRTREGAQVRFERAPSPWEGASKAVSRLEPECDEEPDAGHSEDVPHLLMRLNREHDVLIRLAEEGRALEVVGTPSAILQAALEARRGEILQHLQASPGSHILGYPDEERLQPLAWQERTIASRTKRGRIAEVIDAGVPRLRWFPDVSPARIQEIADELEQEMAKKREEKAAKRRAQDGGRPGGRTTFFGDQMA